MIELKNHLSTILDFLVNKKQIKQLFSNDNCLLCHSAQSLNKELICKNCIQDLPFNESNCYQCGLPIRQNYSLNTEILCGECTVNQPHFTKTIAPFTYYFPIKQAIHEGKYNNKRYWLKYLSSYITDSILVNYTELELPDLIIPVPMHSTKLKQRGYNQALLIAQSIANELDIKIEKNWVMKTKETTSNALQSKKERTRSLRNAFEINPKAKLENAHIALVDDVMTTKATCNTISDLLKKANAKRVDVWCIARTPKY